MVSFDIKGAYNGVNKDILVHRLRERRVPEPIVQWVYQFCSDRRASIMINGQESEVMDVEHAGLPQGSPLSPILFLFYNANLVASKLSDQKGSMAFMDDYSVWITGKSPEANTYALQNVILPRVEKW